MPLVIDSSRAFRSPNELNDLIRAILTASPNDEAAWIEWKNGLVLTDKETRVHHIVRHILGMANRPVEEAARHAEGCGYIVIGAEPGHCGGVAEIDPADLDAGLRPYLGSDGPRWGAQYRPFQGKSVLVITVEPPRRGDRAFTLQRAFQRNQTNYHSGMTFVRRAGRTIPAEPGDTRALEDRFLASDHPVTLHVRPTGTDDSITIRPLANLEQRFREWSERRRAELLRESMRPNQPPSRLVVTLNETVDEQYEAEVDQYLAASWNYYAQVAVSRLLERGELQVPITLVNTSDRNYTDVRIEVTISKPTAMGGNPEGFDFPSPPVVPRKDRRQPPPASVSPRLPWSTIGFTNTSVANNYLGFTQPKPPFTIKAADEALIVTYDVDRVRPEQRIPLAPFLLLYMAESTGTNAEADWKLTAGNVDGVARGILSVTIGEPFDAAEILPELVSDLD